MRKLLSLMVTASILLMASIAVADNTVIFQWDENTETDLAGYRLYQSDTPDGQVIDGTSFVAEIAPNAHESDPELTGIEAGKDAYRLLNVPDGTLYWVLTAYDTTGNESGKSNEVSATLDSTPPGAPVILEITAIVKAP